EPYCFAIHNAQISPLLACYRPSYLEKFGIKFDDFEVLPQKRIREGLTCVVLSSKARSPSGTFHTLWVVPERGFLPVHYAINREMGATQWTIDITYKQNKRYGWAPSGWRSSTFSPKGNVQETSEVKITDFEINRPIPPKEFRLDFPPGTFVVEESK